MTWNLEKWHGHWVATRPTGKLTFSVTYWQRCRSWSPSGRISGSTMGTRPFWWRRGLVKMTELLEEEGGGGQPIDQLEYTA